MIKKLMPLVVLLIVLTVGGILILGGKDSDAATSARSGGTSQTPSASSDPGGVAQTLDLALTADKLLDLRSFRFDLTLKLVLPAPDLTTSGSEEDAFGAALAAALFGAFGDIKAEGAFVAPDKMDVKATIAGQEISFVQIGNRSWAKYFGSWQELPAGDSMLFGLGAPTELVSELLPQEALKVAKTSTETVNGVSTTHYAFDKAALQKLLEATGEDKTSLDAVTEAKLDVWLNADSIPVKIAMDMAGLTENKQKMSVKLELNLRDINSSSITINPPI